ncbi:MAG: ABC transporter permease [bacterium]|nr:ABC transporter permease [bacterium]
MKFELFIAKRYLLKGRKNSFISTISLVSIIGITIGVAALIIALSLINGFQNDIRDKLLNSSAHIIVNNIVGEGFDGYEDIIKEIEKRFPTVKSAEPVVMGTVLLKGGARSASGAVIRGVDLDVAKKFWAEKVIRGFMPLKKNQIMVGKDIASKTGLMEHRDCTVVTPRVTLSPTGIIPRMKKMLVSGVFKTGLYELDNTTAITNLETAQRLFGLKNKISYIQLYLEDVFEAESVAEELRAFLPPRLSVITWKDLNASLYSALDLEKTVLFFTLTLIIIVASLNIIAGLILLVIQKVKDIGILLSYGATQRTIKRIFFLQGGIIGVLGTFAGAVIGLLFCYCANQFELIKVPAEIYQMSFVPFTTKPLDFFAVVLITLVITFTATLIPSRKAASVNVVDAIKNE